jgi:hypothetical protein
VIKSNLRKLGLLDELRVRGDLIVNEAFYYNATSNRLGINTLDPSGVLSVHENGVEVSIRGEDYLRAKIGTVTKHDLHLMVNDQTAVSIDIDGKVVIGADSRNNAKLTVNHNVDSDYAATLTNTGMGLAISAGSNSKLVVTNKQTKAVEFIVDDNKVGIGVAKPLANLHVAGDVKLMGKHMSSAPSIPSSGNHYQGDIVWNSNPGPTQYIGWVCVKDGVPGVWAGFGRIDDIS